MTRLFHATSPVAGGTLVRYTSILRLLLVGKLLLEYSGIDQFMPLLVICSTLPG